MPTPKPKPPKTLEPPNEAELQSEIAAFASSIGLSSSLPYSGFNDSDFRKSGPINPTNKSNKPPKNPNPQFNKTPNSNPLKNDTKSTKNKDLGYNSNSNRKFNKNSQSNQPKFDNKTTKNSNPNRNFNSKTKVSDKFGANWVDSEPNDRFENLPKLPLMKASSLGVWYVDLEELESKVIGNDGNKKRAEFKSEEHWKVLVAKKKKIGERLMFQFAKDYEASKGKSGDIKMLMATQRSGTAADKVSAFSVLVGENPVANVRSLDALLAMVTSKVGKRHSLTGFEALKELFTSSLLPDRKLKSLFQRPLNHLPESKDGYSLLLLWYWEECLKQRYERFVIGLEEASRDTLPILKDKALKTMYALLRSKSEQERRLLSGLVNKLGDPESKGASNADYHLTNLLSDHPNMKAVVIDEVDSFLFRPHLGLRSKYHAVNFLSQIRLSHIGDGPNVAKRLVDVYFALFKVLISEANGGQKVDNKSKKKDRKGSTSAKDGKEKSSAESHVEMDSRLLSVLLTGVNRAFPFVSSEEADNVIEVQTPMLFQLVHSKSFNVGIQALMLLDKISAKNQIVSDRFYRALYAKLLLPAVMTSSKAEMFFGLLLRAMKNDINLKRACSFSKRLLQIALQQPPQYACGCLFLLSEVLKAKPPLWNVVLQNESLDDDLEHFEDIDEETETQPNNSSKKEENSIIEIPTVDSDGDSSHDEVDSQASYSEDDVPEEKEDLLLENSLKGLRKSEIVNRNSGDPPQKNNGDPRQETGVASSLPGGYDPRSREPSYCNADRVSWWELMVLASHVHPSVATMARTLLSGVNIVYNGNPLNDLSLTAFMDKFMEKKPKATTWHGGSQIEPAKKLDMNKHLIGAEILSLADVDVPPEDLVFHKFYVNKMNSSKKPKKKKKEANENEAAEELDEVDSSDESDNEEIDDILDSAALPAGDYDYDDLDQVVGDDDDDLVGDVSDGETDFPEDITEGDEAVDEEIRVENDVKKRKRKSGKKKSGASPFASLEDYEHLLDDDQNLVDDEEKSSTKKQKPKSRKKRKASD